MPLHYRTAFSRRSKISKSEIYHIITQNSLANDGFLNSTILSTTVILHLNNRNIAHIWNGNTDSWYLSCILWGSKPCTNHDISFYHAILTATLWSRCYQYLHYVCFINEKTKTQKVQVACPWSLWGRTEDWTQVVSLQVWVHDCYANLPPPTLITTMTKIHRK